MQERHPIATRIAGFLQQFPPFPLLGNERLQALADKARVRYHKAGEILFKQGDAPGDSFFVVASGSVKLITERNEREELIDVCDEGDVFGVRPKFVGDTYVARAEFGEETILYELNWPLFSSWLGEIPGVALFFAAGFAGGLPVVREQLESGQAVRKALEGAQSTSTLNELHVPELNRKLVHCSPDTSIMLGASIMRDQQSPYLLVTDANQWPLGIVTDTDLRNRVVTGELNVDEAVSVLMSSPVICVSPDQTMAALLITMLRHKLHHLVVTENGRNDSKVLGVITDHDLLLSQGQSPAALVSAMKQTYDADGLRQLRDRADRLFQQWLEHDVRPRDVAAVATALNDALIEKWVQLSISAMKKEGWGPAPVAFAWLSLGSEGREEQIVRTDQDNALVYAQPVAGEEQKTAAWFLELGKRVTQGLEHCGFEYCPANMMASNPAWCLSLDAWMDQFAKWMHTPDPKSVMYTTIFFDYRVAAGDKRLAERLTDFIFGELQQEQLFLRWLAHNALRNPPPLGFFRNFLVEKAGVHHDSFDIKARAMMPLTDAARVLTLYHRLPGYNNTPQRFLRLAAKEPQHASLYEEAARAYEILMRYRAQQAYRKSDSGRYIDPQALSKIDRQLLRSAFQPISDLQELLEVRFQTNQLRG